MKWYLVGPLAASLLVGGALSLPVVQAQAPATSVPAPVPAPVCPPPVAPLAVRLVPAEPSVTLRLGDAEAHAVPHKHGCGKTGGGNVEVRQIAPDTIVVTMTGVAVAGGLLWGNSSAGFNLDLSQHFKVVYETPNVCGAELHLQGRVVGLLRNPCHGSANCSTACATVVAEGDHPLPIASISLPGKTIGGKEDLAVLTRQGPVVVPIGPGCYTLQQTFSLSASQPACQMVGKPASAEFAPAPALDPTWISYKDPFHGVAKKDFGFQVTLRVVPLKSQAAPQPTRVEVLVKPKE